jgi:preprotein translocase subunit SecD
MLAAGALLVCSTTHAAVLATHFASGQESDSPATTTRLVLQVHVGDAVNITVNKALGRLRDELRARNFPGDVQKRLEKSAPYLLIIGISSERALDVQNLLKAQFPDWNSGLVGGNTHALEIRLNRSAAAAIRDQALRDAIVIIRDRLKLLGVAGATVQEYGRGAYEIEIQLPKLDDPVRVKSVIQVVGMLELKLVQDGPHPSREAALAAHGGILPPDSQLLPGKNEAPGQAGGEAWYIVNQIAAVTGRDIRGAEPAVDSTGQPCVEFTLTPGAAGRFARLTSANVGKRLAVVFDNRVVSVPVIRNQLSGSMKITDSFTPQQAEDLALVLRSGVLPASISFLSEQAVGP